MVEEIAAEIVWGLFLVSIGALFGFSLAVYLIEPPDPKTVEDSNIVQRTLAKFSRKPEPTKPVTPIGALPRGAKGWRQQRMDLQREHNSVQKQRDSGLPAL